MGKNKKDILQYVGDDGELLHPIDDCAEEALSEDQNVSSNIDDPFDLYDYRYPFHGWPWQRWLQYREYHTLLRQLPKYQVKSFGWFARLTRNLEKPSGLINHTANQGLTLFVSSTVLMLFCLILFVFSTVLTIWGSFLQDIGTQVMDKNIGEMYLMDHRAEILDTTMKYRKCMMSPSPTSGSIGIYEVTEDSVTQIDTLGSPRLVNVYVPQDSDGWYQLAQYHGEVGMGILRADELGSNYCVD